MIELVRIDYNYIDVLRKVDSKVQSNSQSQNKDTKPFLGILFALKNNEEIEYFVPLSSPKEKHLTMPNSADFHKIYNKKGRLIAVLNFNNMVPTTARLYNTINISTDKDKIILHDEYVFCRDRETILKNKAEKLYERYKNNQLTEKEKNRTCDFFLLEKELKNYLYKIESKTSSSDQLLIKLAQANKEKSNQKEKEK